jgi:RNA polymerase sigma-70 factor (ECF subfamily)
MPSSRGGQAGRGGIQHSPLEREATITRDERLAGWVEAYGEELERHLLRMSLRAEDAHDVLQEVWVTALDSPPADGPGSNPRAWLYRVATRRALDVLARDRRRRELISERPGRVTPEPEVSPDAWVARIGRETRRRVRASVAELPRRQREAVWLRWLEACDYETIADRLGGSPETARANVDQGLKRLRCQLSEVWQEERSV